MASLASTIDITHTLPRRKFYRYTKNYENGSTEINIALDSIISYTVNFTTSENSICTRVSVHMHMRRGHSHLLEFDMTNKLNHQTCKHLIDLLEENFEIL